MSEFCHIISFGFCAIKADTKDVFREISDFKRSIFEKHNIAISESNLNGKLDDILSSLYPLVSPVPTKEIAIDIGDGWVVILDNGYRGTDAGHAYNISRLCNCVGIRVISRIDTMRKRISNRRYGAEIVEIFKSGSLVRGIYCANDGGRWIFDQYGSPLEIELLDKYNTNPIKNAFTRDDLLKVLNFIGFSAINIENKISSGDIKARIYIRNPPYPNSYLEHDALII